MKSKAFHAFKMKLDYFDDDLDLMDVLRTSVIQGDLTETGSSNVLKNVDSVKHTHIARRQNSDGSRKNIINHLRSSLYSSYVKDVYEEVTHYLKTILEQAAKNGLDAGRLIGEHSFKIDAKAVLQEGSWENITRLITDSVFQKLESERSTLALLKKINTKLNLNIDENLIDTALPYLEVRHFLIHSDRKLPLEFTTKYPNIPTTSDGLISLNYLFICQLRDSVHRLIAAYDDAIITNNLLDSQDTQP